MQKCQSPAISFCFYWLVSFWLIMIAIYSWILLHKGWLNGNITVHILAEWITYEGGDIGSFCCKPHSYLPHRNKTNNRALHGCVIDLRLVLHPYKGNISDICTKCIFYHHVLTTHTCYIYYFTSTWPLCWWWLILAIQNDAKNTLKWLKPWHMGSHLTVLSESYPMYT